MMSLSKAVASGKTAALILLSVTSVAEQHQSIGEGRVMCSCPSLLLNINLCSGEQSWSGQVVVTISASTTTLTKSQGRVAPCQGGWAHMPLSCAHVYPSA